MRLHLLKVLSHMCRISQLEWAKFDAFVNYTDPNMSDTELLVELILCCSTDHARVMRFAMGLERMD